MNPDLTAAVVSHDGIIEITVTTALRELSEQEIRQVVRSLSDSVERLLEERQRQS